MNASDAVPPSGAASDRALVRVVRAEAARIVAALTSSLGNFDLAEEAVADAVAEALLRWRAIGVPPNPGAWLTTAARRNALDRLRREKRYRQKLEILAERPDAEQAEIDERLPLLFGCCHPALSPSAQLALTLRAVCGLTTEQIARATLSAPTAVGQRIVRAKRKIAAAGIPLRIPIDTERASRLDIVLTVISVMYNEAHLVRGGGAGADRDLADDALWLAQVVAGALPQEPEAHGLVSLLQFHRSREPARAFGGELVILADQDRSRWDPALVAAAHRSLAQAAALRRPGRWQLHAAIAACHSDAKTARDTDWNQIVVLYDMLLDYDPSPVVRLNRAVARAETRGAAAALADIDELATALDGFHLWHAVRAHLLRHLGRRDEALAEDAIASELTSNEAERRLLESRGERVPGDTSVS
ncbi:MAG: sigma factor-like helix-turn-helix DNA-binding protein [Candidatus Microbacterium colombiense]|nr:MAG: sigma factor-like helix-turn-helix DNA-binding protein [Microbacterium sp.]